MKVGDIKIFEVAPEALNYYRKHTKGNYNQPEGVVVMKLARNIHLGHKQKKLTDTIYTYGNLKIVTRLGKIVELNNHPGNKIEGWLPNMEEYGRVSKQLGIPDYKNKRNY